MQKVLWRDRTDLKTFLVRTPFFWILLILPLCLLSACGSAGIFANGNWQASGLQNQQIRVLEVNAKNPMTLYAGNVQGHVFVSVDAGLHWTEQSDGLPLPDPMHALAFDDATQNLYAATDRGLFVKKSETAQWMVVSASHLPVASFTSLAFASNSPNVIYTGTEHQGVFVSNDSGVSWFAASNGLPQGIAIHDLTFDPIKGQLWAATPAGAYRSADHGTSWQLFNTGVAATSSVNTIVSAASSGGAVGLLYMGTTHGFFFSQDAGLHWTQSQEALSAISIHRILVDFRGARTTSLYVATDVGVFQSTTSGQTWQSVAAGLPKNAPVYALTLAADSYTQLYAAGTGLYQFPGTGTGVDPGRIFVFVVLAVIVFLLYRLIQRKRPPLRSVRTQAHPPQGQGNPTADNPSTTAS